MRHGPLSSRFRGGCMADVIDYFVQFWSNDAVRQRQRRAGSLLHVRDALDVLDCVSHGCRVRPGDLVYAASFQRGRLRVLGWMGVGDVADAEAAAAAEDGVAAGTLRLVAAAASPVSFDGWVEPSDVDRIEFITPTGRVVGPARRPDGSVDPGTFRGLRRITARTARIFDGACDAFGPGEDGDFWAEDEYRDVPMEDLRKAALFADLEEHDIEDFGREEIIEAMSEVGGW